MARVSILMSCHGTGRWLPEALASIPWDMEPDVLLTANGREDWDAVTDGAARYPVRSVILRTDTLTLSASLNVMLVGALGEYVMRLDPDDKLPAGTLAEMLAAADAAPKPCFVYGGFEDFGDRERVVLPKTLTARVLRDHCPGADNILIDTRLAREIGGWEEIGYEDWHFYTKLLRSGATAVMLDSPVLLHRVRPGSRYATMVADNDKHIAAIREALV